LGYQKRGAADQRKRELCKEGAQHFSCFHFTYTASNSNANSPYCKCPMNLSSP